MQIKSLLGCLFVGTSALTLFAAERIVPDPDSTESFYTQMTNLLTTAKSGDVITIREGTYSLAEDEVMDYGAAFRAKSPGITVRGDPAAGPEKVVLKGNAVNYGFYSLNYTINIENLTFDGFAKEDSGSAVRGHTSAATQAAKTVVSNCVFRNCRSKNGAAYIVSLVDCVLSNNISSASGGAAAGCHALRCHFENNTANGCGGAISGPYSVSNCVFTANRTQGTNVGGGYDGGALNSFSASLEVYGCAFTNNFALRGGGAASCQGATFRNCTFYGNEANTEAPSSWISSCLCKPGLVVDCVFEENLYSSCVLGDKAFTVIDGCQFFSNKGVSYICARNVLEIRNSLAKENQTEQHGAFSGIQLISNCTFIANSTAIYDGGTIYNCGICIDSRFIDNEAKRWGGAAFGGGYVRCVFSGNKAGQYGNALYYPTFVEGCTFTEDQACCGGSYTRCAFLDMTRESISVPNSLPAVACTSCLFARCSSARVAGGCVSLQNCTFADCVTDVELIAMKADGTIQNCLFFNNFRLTNGQQVRDDARIALSGSLVANGNAYGESVFDFAAYGSGNLRIKNPKFVGEGDAPYQLRPSGVNRAVRMGGIVEDWMTGARDLAGNGLLRDGQVSIGCYTCWQDPLGAFILIR